MRGLTMIVNCALVPRYIHSAQQQKEEDNQRQKCHDCYSSFVCVQGG